MHVRTVLCYLLAYCVLLANLGQLLQLSLSTRSFAAVAHTSKSEETTALALESSTSDTAKFKKRRTCVRVATVRILVALVERG